MKASSNGADRRLHDARQVKIKAARKKAITRFLTDKEAHEQLRRNAQARGRETLLQREAVTDEQIEQWAQESARLAEETHDPAT